MGEALYAEAGARYLRSPAIRPPTVECLPTTARPHPPTVALTPLLAQLDAARANPGPGAAAGLLTKSGQLSAATKAGALARLTAEPQAPLADLLRLPSPDGQGVTSTKIGRGHFAIMQRNNDGIGYPDLCPRLRDSFSDTFAGPLYPSRCLVPGPVLRALDL